MRLTDIFLFEDQELTEIDMSPSGLMRQAAGVGAMVGIEFEMIVPGVAVDDNETEAEPDYSMDETAYNIDQICDFFDDGDFNSRRDINRLRSSLESDFTDWALDQFEDRWDSDKEEFIYDYLLTEAEPEDIAALLGIDPDKVDGFSREQLYAAADKIVINKEGAIYNAAYEHHRDEFMQQEDLQELWLSEEQLDSMTAISNSYSIAWPHYNYESSDGGELDLESLAQEFSAAVGKKVNYSQSYHGGRREPDKYVVEPDGSLSADDDGDEGLEFISPPMPMQEMFTQMRRVIEWAKGRGCYTNKSTGLHMNVSVPNFSRDNLDYVKLTLLLGDEYILNSFGRLSNTYTKSAMGKIRDRVASQPADTEQLLQAMKGHLQDLASRTLHSGNTDKYTSINTKGNYIEFRSPGGDWLNEDIGKLESTITRFVVALDAALDPKKHRNEYLSKLQKLLTAGQKQNNDIIQHFVQYSSGALPKQALKSFIRQAQLQRRINKEPGEKYWWKVQIGPAAIEVVATNNSEAWTAALKNQPLWTRYSIRQAEITPLRPYKFEEPEATPEPDQTPSTGRTPMRYNNPTGRESNPQGQYVIMMSYGDPPLYRFDAANINDAREVFYQWQEANPEVENRLRYDWDPNMLFGQPAQARTNYNMQPPPELNGRPSNPDGNAYIAFMNDVNTPLYRFMAANGDDARTVLDQWDRQYGGNYVWRPDPRQEHGQPAIPGSTIDLARRRAAAAQSQQQPAASPSDAILAAPESNPDANWAIVRNSDDAIIEYFTRNTPAEAETAFNRWIESLDADNNIRTNYRLEPVEPRTTSAQTQPAAQTEPQANWTSRNQLWRILINGEEVHNFWNTNVQSDANQAARTWVLDQIRRGLLSPEEGADVEVVPVRA